MHRQSWFNFGFGDGGKADAAKEEAARLTREADIRRLYEAGTQREVLEQLYKPEEVFKCIDKIEKEKMLLELLEEEAEAEATRRQSVLNVPSIKLATVEDSPEEVAEEVHVPEKENLELLSIFGDEAEMGTTSEGSKKNGRRFTLRFDSADDDDDGVNLKTMVEPLDDDSDDTSKKDKAIDHSLDDFLAEGMDSVCMNEDDREQLPRLAEQAELEQQESDDDLLKELLNTEGEESSQFDDDSVTTKEENAQQKDDGSVEAIENKCPENLQVTIDTSAVTREYVATTGSQGSTDSSQVVVRGASVVSELGIGSSYNSSQRQGDDNSVAEREIPADTPSPAGSSEEERECPSNHDAQNVHAGLSGFADTTADERKIQDVHDEKSDVPGEKQVLTDRNERRDAPIETKDEDNVGDEKDVAGDILGAVVDVGGSQEKRSFASDSERGKIAGIHHGHKSEDVVHEPKLHDFESVDENENVPSALEAEKMLDDETIIRSPSHNESVDTMDAEAELEEEVVMSDEDEDALMDERELMETVSVEDDEELSEQSPKLPERGDVDMNDGLQAPPEAMDAADEVEEVVMHENKSDDGISEVVALDEKRESAVSLAESVSTDGSEPSSNDSTPLPPPSLPDDAVDNDEDIVEEEVVEDHAESIVIKNQDGRVLGNDEGVQEEEVEEEEIVEENDVEEEEVDDEVEVEEVVDDASSASSYADQVVESWHEVIEEQPEDLEAAVSALIAVVYKDEDVDVESMLRRTRLPELYKYLKSQYWYKIHTNEDEAGPLAKAQFEKPSEIVSVDDMLKGRMESLIKNVQRMDRSDRSAVVEDDTNATESVRRESQMLNLINNVQMSSRSLLASEKMAKLESHNMLGKANEDDEEEEDFFTGKVFVDKSTIHKLSSEKRGTGGHHVAKYYEKAVNNRAHRYVPKSKADELDSSKSHDSEGNLATYGECSREPDTSNDTEKEDISSATTSSAAFKLKDEEVTKEINPDEEEIVKEQPPRHATVSGNGVTGGNGLGRVIEQERNTVVVANDDGGTDEAASKGRYDGAEVEVVNEEEVIDDDELVIDDDTEEVTEDRREGVVIDHVEVGEDEEEVVVDDEGEEIVDEEEELVDEDEGVIVEVVAAGDQAVEDEDEEEITEDGDEEEVIEDDDDDEVEEIVEDEDDVEEIVEGDLKVDEMVHQ